MPVICKADGCSKQASYGSEGGKCLYCTTHKLSGHVHLRSRRCAAPGCTKHPSFGDKGLIATFCKDHKPDDYASVTPYKCQAAGCTKQAHYGERGSKKRTHCAEHKLEDHADLRTVRCQEPECDTAPHFGVKGTKKPTHCKTHAPEGYVDVVSRRCEGPDCDVMPSFGPKGTTTAVYCKAHAPDDYENVRRPRCPNCNLFTTNDGKLCAACNPNAHQKTREMGVVTFLEKQQIILGKFVHDKLVDTDCGRERPDIRYDCATHHVIVEVDEDQHRDRAFACEQTRMAKIIQALGGAVTFIRYNPDKYTSVGMRRDPPADTRLSTLVTILKSEQRRAPTSLVRVIYMFYDDTRKVARGNDVIAALNGEVTN
jgi:hypothetical protein